MEQQKTQVPFKDALNYMDAWQSGRLNLGPARQQEIMDAASLHGITVEFVQNDADNFYFALPSDRNGALNDEAMGDVQAAAAKAAAGSASSVACAGSASTVSTLLIGTVSSASTASSAGTASSVGVDSSDEHLTEVLAESGHDVVDYINAQTSK